MASGFGYAGGRSRCHPFWQEFAKCFANAETRTECTAQKEDYLECLHHTKEIKRAQTVKSHYLHSQQHLLAQRKEEAVQKATPGGIMGLNLIALEHQESSDSGSDNGKQDKPQKEGGKQEKMDNRSN